MSKYSITISVLTLVLALFANQAGAVVPVVDNIGRAANPVCKPAATRTATGAVNPQPVLHFDKIIFAITGQPQLTAVSGAAADQDALKKIPVNTELDIKVVDNPARVADLKAKVLSFLGAVSTPQFYPAIRIISVEYTAVICPIY